MYPSLPPWVYQPSHQHRTQHATRCLPGNSCAALTHHVAEVTFRVSDLPSKREKPLSGRERNLCADERELCSKPTLFPMVLNTRDQHPWSTPMCTTDRHRCAPLINTDVHISHTRREAPLTHGGRHLSPREEAVHLPREEAVHLPREEVSTLRRGFPP